jgi:hypothetical protein
MARLTTAPYTAVIVYDYEIDPSLPLSGEVLLYNWLWLCDNVYEAIDHPTARSSACDDSGLDFDSSFREFIMQ